MAPPSGLVEEPNHFLIEGFEPNPSQRGTIKKFKLLLEGKQLKEEELGDWLRRHGMHTEHLALWEQKLEGIVMDKQESLRQKNKDLVKEVKRLKREAQRNDKQYSIVVRKPFTAVPALHREYG